MTDVVGCAAMLCIEGSFCTEDASGRGSCVSYPTCNTTKCASGSYCADRPIVCVTTPCAPTAPSCETCPRPGTTINCMPIVSPTNAPLCATADSIRANCPGVDFVY